MTRSFFAEGTLFLLLTGACAGAGGADFRTASKLPSGERKPDGVAVDLVSEPPPSGPSGETGDGVVTLRAPLGTTAAMATLASFFDAVLHRDINAMSIVMTSNAIASDTRSYSQNRNINLNYLWRQRFAKYDYALLAGRVVYRESDVRTYHSDDADALPYDLKAAAAGGEPLLPGDLVLRVPIVNHSVKNERMLGDELTFWLRRDESRFLIYRVAEEIPM